MNEARPSIVVSAVEHDPQGLRAKHFQRATYAVESLYQERFISFTERSHHNTIDAARDCGWDIVVEETSMSAGRFRGVERGLSAGSGFINLWDADRLIYAANIAPDELKVLTQDLPQYDFFIAGGTPEAIKTHPSSLIVREAVKSWRLGRYLDIEGDIANRGCLGFSREFATFALTHSFTEEDEPEGALPILAVAYQHLLRERRQEGRGIGYKEYSKITTFDEWFYEESNPEECAIRKSTLEDFEKRRVHVDKILETAERFASRYGV